MKNAEETTLEKWMRHIERGISIVLIVLGLMFIIYQTIQLVWLFGSRVYSSTLRGEFFEGEEGHPIGGLFFGILLLMEIVETIKVFSKGHVVKVRIILIVGLIAVTRKILMTDMEHVDPMVEFAIASLILSLSVGYYLITRSKSGVTKQDPQ